MAFSGDKTYFEPLRDKGTKRKKRVCDICGKRLLPFHKTETLVLGAKTLTVHSKCKKRAMEQKVPSED